jgi:hypothetical protein
MNVTALTEPYVAAIAVASNAPTSRRSTKKPENGSRHVQRHRAREAGRDLAGELRLRKREAALEAERHQKVEREDPGDRGRNLEIGPDGSGDDPEDEEQDRWVKQVLHVGSRRSGRSAS